MIIDITRENHDQIKNRRLAEYAAIYLDIYNDFMGQVAASGIAIDDQDYSEETAVRVENLRQKGAILRNTDRSIYVNAISPACVACQKGVGSATFFTSLQCHRDCYYCFNPNQVEYDYFQQNKRNPAQELIEIQSAGHRVDYLALTGGEPLLHKAEATAFFQTATETFPHAHTRLYTTGDHANEATLQELQAAGLEEIRFSIRMHDLAKGHRLTFDRIALARQYIPTVMVEMPILPGILEEMKAVLLELERLQIHSINLLEFCYPFANPQAFNERGFKVKQRPFHILYNYWYAGGVPISESELVCLDLMEFALEQKLTIGVHYCSLENKLTGQNYQQNYGRSLPKTAVFSEKDYLLKSAKVFGSDISKVLNVFNRNGYRDYRRSREHRYLEFHIDQIPNLADLNIEIGLSTSTLEMREDELVARELKVDLTRPELFDIEDI
ncbi:MAG: radical SAM protein [Ardenticatenaceae bacterium]|nr:radical SAM protein [Ardenticatenaceae bacterium]MCB9443468.1 radical SAM protein [Ardenticatenaceae bacterium]